MIVELNELCILIEEARQNSFTARLRVSSGKERKKGKKKDQFTGFLRVRLGRIEIFRNRRDIMESVITEKNGGEVAEKSPNRTGIGAAPPPSRLAHEI